jgi:hypothetical protein
VVEVRAREAGHLWEVTTEVRCQSIDDLGAPSLTLLAVEDLVPDLPVELDQLAVDREHRTSTRSLDPRLDLGKERRIVGRQPSQPGSGTAATRLLDVSGLLSFGL